MNIGSENPLYATIASSVSGNLSSPFAFPKLEKQICDRGLFGIRYETNVSARYTQVRMLFVQCRVFICLLVFRKFNANYLCIKMYV